MQYAVDKNLFRFNSLPSLEDIAMISVVIKLWELPDSTALLNRNWAKMLEFSRGWEEYEDHEVLTLMTNHVSKKLQLLPLPKNVKEKMSAYVRSIGIEFFDWIYDSFPVPNWKQMKYISWTADGSVNEQKTLQKLESAAIIQMDDLFKLACFCCSEDYILSLWGKLSVQARNSFSEKSMFSECEDRILFVAYWVCYCRKKLHKFVSLVRISDYNSCYDYNSSISKNMFTLSLELGNMSAAKYFWPQLSADEINENAMKWFECHTEDFHSQDYFGPTVEVAYAKVLLFLLSKLNEPLQGAVVSRFGEYILVSLFKCWPWQRFLIPTLCAMQDQLKENNYMCLFTAMADQVEDKFVKKLVKDVWSVISVKLKKNLRCMIGNSYLFDRLVDLEDFDTLGCVLQGATDEEFRNIVENDE